MRPYPLDRYQPETRVRAVARLRGGSPKALVSTERGRLARGHETAPSIEKEQRADVAAPPLFGEHSRCPLPDLPRRKRPWRRAPRLGDAAPWGFYRLRAALAGIIGGRREWTALTISLGSIPCKYVEVVPRSVCWICG
jgi:hypothetical protein